MAGFGSLIPQDWQQQEAEQNLRAIEEARIEKERAGKTWGQTASDVLTMPSRLVRSIAASTPEATDDQRAYWGSLVTSPMLNKPAHVINTIGGGLVDAVKSGATLPGEVSQGKIPMWQDGQTNPEIVHRAFDTASLAGGASAAGNVGRDVPGRLGRDVRILGREVGSGEPFPHQLIDQPEWAHPSATGMLDNHMPPVGNPSYDMPTMPRVTPEHRPPSAVDAFIDSQIGRHANDDGLTSVAGTGRLLSDTGKPGAAIAAAEHAQPFFLTGEEALKNTARKSGTGEQWMNELKRYGAKPEELDWRGATEFLQKNSNTPITRAAVEEHLASNPFGLKRVDYNSMPENWKDLPSDLRYRVEEVYKDVNGGPPRDLPDWYENIASQSNKGGETALDGVINPARWSQYKLPGGENYRERLQTIPPKVDLASIAEAHTQNAKRIQELRRQMHGTSGTDEIRAEIRRLQNEDDALAKQGKEAHASTFKSDHFDDPNILYHRRTTDRTFYEPPTPEHQAALDARRAAEGEINGIVQQQHIVGRQIREAAKPLEYARRMSVQADIDAGRITTGAGWRKMMEDVVDHPELKPLQDKLQGLRAQEDAVRKAMPPEPERKGSRSVHDEEQQSDMHQHGRKRGYNTPQVEADRQRGYQLTRKINEAVDQAPPGRPAERMQWAVDNVPEFGKWVAERNGIDDVAMKNVIPNAPFKESWPDLALKDLIREAAEKGADEISWTSGRSSPTNPRNLGGHMENPENIKIEQGLIQHYDKNQVSRANKVGKAHGVQVFEHNEPVPASEGMSGEKAMRILGLDQNGPNWPHEGNYWDRVKDDPVARQKLFEDAYKQGHKIFRMKVPQSLKDQALKNGFSLFEDAGPAGAAISALEHAAPTKGKPDWHAALKGEAYNPAAEAISAAHPTPARGEGLAFPEEESAARLRQKVNREEKAQKKGAELPGGPSNERTVVKAPEGSGLPDFVAGKITFDDWKNRVERMMTPDEIHKSAKWYDEIRGEFLKHTGGDEALADKYMKAWLVAQQNVDVSGAMHNTLLQREQVLRGVPEDKMIAAGMPNPTIAARRVMQDRPIEGGVGHKIADFVDAAAGKDVRSWMANDPRGGSPFVVDVHTARDTGLVDQRMINHLERMGYDPEALKSLKVDWGGPAGDSGGLPSPTYENRAKFGRELTQHLNDIKWQGRDDWKPREVQAAGWMAMTKLTANKAEDVLTGLQNNMRHLSMELAPGEGSPWAAKFGDRFSALPAEKQRALTHEISQDAIKRASEIAGVDVRDIVHGTGGWQTFQNPSTVAQAFASKQGAEIAANALGHLLQQTEVWSNKVKPLTSNPKGFAVDIIASGEHGLSSDAGLRDLWSKIMAADPTAASKSPLFQGYQPIKMKDGRAGIRVLIDRGGSGVKNTIENGLGPLENMLKAEKGDFEIRGHEAEIYKARNDWKEHPNGEGYKQRLVDLIGRDRAALLDHHGAELERLFERKLGGTAAKAAPAPKPEVKKKKAAGFGSLVPGGP